MTEEYVWKKTTRNIALSETKASNNITFHNGNKQVGALDFNGPEMTFSGDMEESAKMFFDLIARSFKARLDQERADAQRKPLTTDQMYSAIRPLFKSDALAEAALSISFAEYRAIEAAHNIKE
jgi:hypothetical protein